MPGEPYLRTETVLWTLAQMGWATASQVAEILEQTVGAVAFHLKAARKNGWAKRRRNPRGKGRAYWYTISAKGLHRLDWYFGELPEEVVEVSADPPFVED